MLLPDVPAEPVPNEGFIIFKDGIFQPDTDIFGLGVPEDRHPTVPMQVEEDML